jgi:hypothetical protein
MEAFAAGKPDADLMTEGDMLVTVPVAQKAS